MIGNVPCAASEAATAVENEIRRLRRQAAIWASETETLLDLIGVESGWSCLDLGCGPGGISSALSARTGPSGKVFGLDLNADFISAARAGAAKNVRFAVGDAHASGLAGASFDLVHMRFLAWMSPNPEALLTEALRLVRPGGVVALQEPDGSTLKCYPPHPAWTRMIAAFRALVPDAIGDYPAAHGQFKRLQQAGLVDLGYRLAVIGARSGDPAADLWPAAIETARDALIMYGLFSGPDLDATLAEIRRHLADPGTVSSSPTLVQVWGRKPDR